MSSSIMDFLISSSGVNDKLKKYLSENNYKSRLSAKEQFFWDLINKEEVSSRPSFILEEQEKMKRVIQNNKNISISAPTSFGKTHIIIDEIKKTEGLVIIISPTISLCNEYFLKLVSEERNPSMSPNVSADIYILTPEKYLIFKESKKIDDRRISLLIFDEFYEAFSGDRYTVFEEAYDNSVKKADKVIKIIPHQNAKLPEKYRSDIKHPTTASATMRRITKYKVIKGKIKKKWISSEFNENQTDGFEVKSSFKTEEEVFENALNKTKGGLSMIVLSSKEQMFRKLEKASKFHKKSNNPLLIEIEKYLIKTAKHTMLAKYIRYGVAYHNGTMDKFLRILIEAAFTKGYIKVLFGNSAITKGVNLSPDILYIMSYTGARGKSISASIKKIEKINAFGRTGRSIENKNIGNIILFTRSSKNNDDHLIKGIKGDLEIEKPKKEEVSNVSDFEFAYKHYIVNKNAFQVSEDNKRLILNYIQSSDKLESDDKVSGLFKAINEIYNINYNSAGFKNMRLYLIRAYVYKQGYSHLIKSNRDSAIKNGYISRGGGWGTKAKFEADTKKNYIRFKEGTSHEDLIAKNAYEEYEKVAGFYFAQLLSKAIEKFKGDSDAIEILNKYNKRIEAEDSIATKNGWPDSFGDYYITNGSETKEYLDNVMQMIKMD